MKFYSLETKFTFGNYQGKTTGEVIAHKLSYLDWCIINLEHFCFSLVSFYGAELVLKR
jgi:hypothetical protein